MALGAQGSCAGGSVPGAWGRPHVRPPSQNGALEEPPEALVPGRARCGHPTVGGAHRQSWLCRSCWLTLGKFLTLSELGTSSGGYWYR